MTAIAYAARLGLALALWFGVAGASWASPLRTVVTGSTDRSARTLVLVHGNYDRLETWDRLAPLLEDEFRVVALDLPGFGLSPNEGGAYGVEALAAALDEAVRAAGVERAVFVGNSLGGAVVAAYAAAHPERVDALVLEDANLVRAPATDGMTRALGRAAGLAGDPAKASELEAALADALTLALPTPGVVDPALVAHFAGGFDATHWPELRHQASAFSLEGLADRLVAARAERPFPVLVVWGLDDPLIPVDAAERALPRLHGARAVFFAGTGHAPHLERPAELARVLVEAFAGEVTLPAEDVLIPAADGGLPGRSPLSWPRVEAARLRAELADRELRCADGDAAACGDLARRLRDGVGTHPDAARAMDVALAACRGGDADGCLTARPSVGDERLDRRLLEEAREDCVAKDDAGCTRFGLLLAAGVGTERDPERALALWDLACDRGHGPACVRAGDARFGTTPDVQKPLAGLAYGKGCDAGDATGCFVLGAMVLQGFEARPDGVVDHDRGYALLERGCTGGSGVACAMLGGWHTGLWPADTSRLFLRACALGHAGGCVEAGRRAEAGRGGMADPAAAEAHYDRACALGDAEGCAARDALRGRDEHDRARLAEEAPACRGKGPFLDEVTAGVCALFVAPALLDGRLVPPDPERAAAILRRDCDLATGQGWGCLALAPLLAEGRGVRADPEAALRLDRAGCDRDADACLRAGLALAPTDPEEAARYLGRAETGAPLALAGVLLAGAPGVERDPARAERLLESACLGGEGEGCVRLEERRAP